MQSMGKLKTLFPSCHHTFRRPAVLPYCVSMCVLSVTVLSCKNKAIRSIYVKDTHTHIFTINLFLISMYTTSIVAVYLSS